MANKKSKTGKQPGTQSMNDTTPASTPSVRSATISQADSMARARDFGLYTKIEVRDEKTTVSSTSGLARELKSTAMTESENTSTTAPFTSAPKNPTSLSNLLDSCGAGHDSSSFNQKDTKHSTSSTQYADLKRAGMRDDEIGALTGQLPCAFPPPVNKGNPINSSPCQYDMQVPKPGDNAREKELTYEHHKLHCHLHYEQQVHVHNLNEVKDANKAEIEKWKRRAEKTEAAVGKKDAAIATYKADAVKLKADNAAVEKKVQGLKTVIATKDAEIQKLELELGGMKDKQQKKDDKKKADYLEMKRKNKEAEEAWEKKHLGMHLD